MIACWAETFCIPQQWRALEPAVFFVVWAVLAAGFSLVSLHEALRASRVLAAGLAAGYLAAHLLFFTWAVRQDIADPVLALAFAGFILASTGGPLVVWRVLATLRKVRHE